LRCSYELLFQPTIALEAGGQQTSLLNSVQYSSQDVETVKGLTKSDIENDGSLPGEERQGMGAVKLQGKSFSVTFHLAHHFGKEHKKHKTSCASCVPFPFVSLGELDLI
jgi:hypothetical protein